MQNLSFAALLHALTKIVCNSMARPKNDGKGRIGGRAKGTPNKTTKEMREWLAKLVSKNRKQIEADLRALEPKERVSMLERLMQYVLPKQQAVKAEIGNLTDEEISIVAAQVLNQVYSDEY